MPDFIKSLDNIPERFVSPYNPQTVYAETGENRYRLHLAYTADEIRCCDAGPVDPPPADTTPPVALARNPAPDATGVALNASIILEFDEPVTLDPTIGLISVRSQSPDAEIKRWTLDNLDVLYENGGSRLRLRNIPFAPLTFYYVLIGAGAITDLAGNPFPGYVANAWSFQTAAS